MGVSEINSSCDDEMYSSKSKATCANVLQEEYYEQIQSLCKELSVSKEIITALKQEKKSLKALLSEKAREVDDFSKDRDATKIALFRSWSSSVIF